MLHVYWRLVCWSGVIRVERSSCCVGDGMVLVTTCMCNAIWSSRPDGLMDMFEMGYPGLCIIDACRILFYLLLETSVITNCGAMYCICYVTSMYVLCVPALLLRYELWCDVLYLLCYIDTLLISQLNSWCVSEVDRTGVHRRLLIRKIMWGRSTATQMIDWSICMQLVLFVSRKLVAQMVWQCHHHSSRASDCKSADRAWRGRHCTISRSSIHP
jgi:hypothetical protein